MRFIRELFVTISFCLVMLFIFTVSSSSICAFLEFLLFFNFSGVIVCFVVFFGS